ncbi:MAG: HD-GYP domain-containing protein [Clostridia bacterium]|nr:HD-GYP domain-containing protein [Clostridia bacterium]
MNDVKKKLISIAKVLKIAANVAKVFVIIMMVVTILQIIAAFSLNMPFMAGFFDGKLSDIESILGRSAIFAALFEIADLRTMDPVYQKAIELFITLLSLIVLLNYISFFKQLLSHIIEQQQPFSPSTAKRMRKGSYGLLLLVLINPVLGVLLFLLVRFFALIFEYGAYLQDKADKTSRIQEEVIVSLAEITENKSEQTGQHIRRVSEYSRILATQMGLSDEAVENLRLASTMHDLGKLMIPSEILEKPGRLTDDEFAEIKKHPAFGEHLLHNVEGDTMTLAREIALEHHERYDGRGYPNGERGEDISLEGRIVAVADVYDALTSRRSYKDAWDPKEAYDEIVRCGGTQFDPKVVEAFVAAYDQIDAARRKYADEQFAAKAA